MNNKARLLEEFRIKAHGTICAQCGMSFCAGDDVVLVNATDDIIHADCYFNYFDDNKDEFVQTLIY